MSLAAGGTRLGELAGALDWTRTPLGSIGSWPQSLRTATEICLASRFPIVIYWGPAFVTIYNGAYVPILRDKHPWALGRPCRDVWTEIWDVIGPMLAEVMETGAASWSDDMGLVMERRGYPEECYFSFSFTPVRTEEGRVGGVFTAVMETTERVVGARRLMTLRELSQHVTETRTVEQACERAARTLAHNTADLPFSRIYLPGGDTQQLQAIASSGSVPAGVASLGIAAPDGADAGLGASLSRVAAGGPAERVDLGQMDAPLSDAGSPDVPASAMVLPIARAGQATPYGVLLAGISPRRGLDEHYRSFYGLLADGVTRASARRRSSS